MTGNNTAEYLLAEAIRANGEDAFPMAFIQWLHHMVDHDNTIILAYFQEQPPVLLTDDRVLPDVLQHMKEIYLAGAYLLDPFYDLHRKSMPAGCYRIWDVTPDQYNRNKYFIEYYQRTTFVDEIAYVIRLSLDLSLHVCLGRDARSAQRFTPRERNTAKQLAPIVDALVSRHWADLWFDANSGEETVIARLIRLVKETHSIVLTNRQAEVALLILQGHSSVSIGLRLGISAQTVKVFRKQLYKRCKVTSQAELFSLLLPLLGGTTESYIPLPKHPK